MKVIIKNTTSDRISRESRDKKYNIHGITLGGAMVLADVYDEAGSIISSPVNDIQISEDTILVTTVNTTYKLQVL